MSKNKRKTLKEWRKELGLTQMQLAEKSGISYHSLVSYDNMYRVPPVDKGIKIAEALGVEPKDIIWMEDK